MKYLILLLLPIIGFSQESPKQERVLIQMQSDKICINMDTCMMVKANLTLTTDRLFIKDMDRAESIEAEVALYEKTNPDEILALAYTEDIKIMAYFSYNQVLIDYQFDGNRFIIEYKIRTVNGKKLIIFK